MFSRPFQAQACVSLGGEGGWQSLLCSLGFPKPVLAQMGASEKLQPRTPGNGSHTCVACECQ